jgi:hypothetical protein
MKKKLTVTTIIILLVAMNFLLGNAAADIVFSTGSVISTSTSVSVQGTMNETVSLTKNTFGSAEKNVLSSIYTMQNPSGLSWNSHLMVNSDEEKVWVNYFRTGSIPTISWKQVFSG